MALYLNSTDAVLFHIYNDQIGHTQTRYVGGFQGFYDFLDPPTTVVSPLCTSRLLEYPSWYIFFFHEPVLVAHH